MWGAQCENTCNYRCPNSCDVADGSCLYPFNLATGMDIGLGVVINAFGQLAFNYWLTNKLGWRGESFSARELRPAAHFSLSSGDAVSVQEYINSYVTKSVAGATFLGFLGAITGESIVMAHPILNIWPFVVGFAESQVVNVPLQYLYYLWTNRQLKRHGAFS